MESSCGFSFTHVYAGNTDSYEKQMFAKTLAISIAMCYNSEKTEAGTGFCGFSPLWGCLERNRNEVACLDNNDKKKAIAAAMAQIEKNYGKGAVMRLGDRAQMRVDALSTGIMAVDIASGIGGIPRGRIIEIYGPESSGKTTVSLHIIAEAQKNGGEVAFIDAEHALDPTYAEKLGVDIDELIISQPDTGEQALEIVESLVRSNAIDVIVVDSVAALVPKAEIDGEMGDSHVGLHARLMSQALRKLTGIVNKSKTTVVFINQIREKVGVMFGNPETTTGGRALKFYASMRIEVRKGEAIKNGSEIIGSRTKIKFVKNKMAPPFKTAEFDMMFGEGVSKYGCVLDIAVEDNIVNKSGAWFNYGTEKLGQGRENAKKYLKENPELFAEIETKVKTAHGIGDAVEPEEK